MARYSARIVVAALGAILASSSGAASESVAAWSGFCGPNASLRYARPTLRWEVWSDRSQVTGSEMQVDGESVRSKYDTAMRSVVFTPERPLSAGVHRVHCRVVFAGDQSFEREWQVRVADGAYEDLPAANSEQTAALEAVNALRRTLNLPAFVPDVRLNAAAQAHSDYLCRNTTVGHTEAPTLPGFVGTTPTARCEAFGRSGASWEGVAYSLGSVDQVVRALFDAPYHRVPFLQPGTLAFGFGFNDHKATAEFEATRTAAIGTSPADGERDVPTRWSDHEVPSPLRLHTGVTGDVGFPIVVASFGSGHENLKVTSARLTLGSEEVPCLLNTPDNDDYLTNASILIPRNPLRVNAEYRVHIVGLDVNGQPIDREWTFRTGSR